MGYSWCLVVLVCYLVWSFCVGPLGRVTIRSTFLHQVPQSGADSSLKSHRARAPKHEHSREGKTSKTTLSVLRSCWPRELAAAQQGRPRRRRPG